MNKNIVINTLSEQREDIAPLEPKQEAIKQEQALNRTNKKPHTGEAQMCTCLCFFIKSECLRAGPAGCSG